MEMGLVPKLTAFEKIYCREQITILVRLSKGQGNHGFFSNSINAFSLPLLSF